MNVTEGASKWSANFQLKVKGQGHRTSQTQEITAHPACMFTYWRQIKRQRLRCRLQTRPNRLLGLINC